MSTEFRLMQNGLDAVYGLMENVPAASYHADDVGAGEPSLSSSIAHILLTRSAAHAWHRHPKLNPAYAPERSEAFDLGTSAHAYILEGERAFTVVDADDWRSKAAREERDAAPWGRPPILRRQLVEIERMAQAVADQLARFQDRPRPLAAGLAEQTLVWREGGVLCRARLDWLHADHRTIDDLKTTGGSADPEAWIRTQLFASGYDVQAAFYLRGLKVVFGIEGRFRFVVVENKPPYALSVIALGPEALDLANRKVDHALNLWRHCLERDVWPGYPVATCYADPLPWDEARFVERETRGPDGRPVLRGDAP